ncbi:exported hypothetical protein [Crenothrix polyspora]|uniref:PEP-CTERM protein-sorting domain-containing protein n=1 Tax=Crenothrix polyspora TaxID=360316 RepID=A0A1R4H516_9GAMM|nr:hypothetical protein [Crenothrix polyspora]SJM91276.1 exported hypothetical protein [Crenothrix polyspora]
MNTKKMLALAMFALGLSLNTPTYASIIVIDDFSVGQRSVQDNTVDGSTVSSTNGARTLSHNLLSFDSPAESAAKVSYGTLDINNGISENSEVTVSWLLKSGLLSEASNAAFDFTAIKTDSNPTNLKFLLNNAELAEFNIPNDSNKSMLFALTADQLLAVNGGGTLALEINGASGWDLSLDAISFSTDNQAANVPEPALMGLVGISLTALSFANKKKRS